MNDRNRTRHYTGQLSRGTNRHNQPTQTNSNQYNGRPVYQGHASNSYATSNYRHPSNTSTATTGTDPSQSQSQSLSSDDDGCTNLICYSYLIAIISSFLVVLGVYLSLTKFNIQYLYLSLVGISIEAISACLYCMSNIRSSKLARRKQERTNTDFFALSASNESTSLNLTNNLNRRPEIAQVTHILTNRTLRGNDNSTPNTRNGEENVPSSSAIIDNNANTAQLDHQNEQSTSSKLLQPQNIHETTPENDNENQNANSNQAEDGTSDNNQQVMISIPTSDEIDSATTLTTPANQEIPSPLLPKTKTTCQQAKSVGDSAIIILNEGAPKENSATVTNTNFDNLQQNEPLPTQTLPDTTQPSSDNSIDINNSTSQVDNNNSTHQTTSSASANPTGPQQSSHFETNIDLINLQSAEANKSTNNQRRAGRSQHSQRATNTRRTLVMGLSGEEEMVEINEDDLDNMSILPPSYESIANESNKKTSE